MDWWGKFTIQNGRRALVNPKNQPRGVVLAQMEQNVHSDVLTAKASSNTGYSQLRHLPVPETAI